MPLGPARRVDLGRPDDRRADFFEFHAVNLDGLAQQDIEDVLVEHVELVLEFVDLRLEDVGAQDLGLEHRQRFRVHLAVVGLYRSLGCHFNLPLFD